MKKIVVSLFLLLVTSLSFAQEGFKKDVKKYFDYSGQSNGLELIREDLILNIPDDKKEAFNKDLDESFEVLKDKLADLYVKEFTHDEIKEILKFYESPIGKKLVEKNSDLMIKGQEVSKEWGMGLQDLMMKYMGH